MYNNPYINMYNSQANVDRINKINNEIAELEMKKAQAMVPQPITQNFQLAPSNSVMRFANNIEEVQKDYVIGDTPFFSKDMTVLWIKNIKGEIKTYELNEIIAKDEKDIKIEYLMAQIDELKKGKKNEFNASVNEYVAKPSEDEESTNVSATTKFNKKYK